MSTFFDHQPHSGTTMTRRVDVVLAATTVVLAFLGVVMVYSATRDKLRLAGDNSHYFLTRQGMFVVLGVVAMVILAIADYHWLEHASVALYGLMVLSLLSMFVIGSSQLGATRWLQLGPLQLQPSAFASLILIVVVAGYCARRPDGLERNDIIKILALAIVPILLVVKQPDLGSGIVMSIILLVMLVVAGIPNRYLLLLIFLVILGVIAVVHLGLLQQYQVQRITGFLNQNGQQSYNLAQSKAAIGSGGFWGTGLFQGSQTNLSYVPEQQTDFIFSAVGEQLGFVGAASVLALLGLIAWRLLHSAQSARDPFGRLLATGVFTLIAFSVFENAGMTMGIMPIAGIPLPFLSYGGSATLAFFSGIGMVLSVHLRHQR